MYPYVHPVLLSPIGIATAASVVITSQIVLNTDLDCWIFTAKVISWPWRFLRISVRHMKERSRLRRTADALHALRHDREYLLGLLPPNVSSQVLGLLDPVSLGALRQASRQAYLLVSTSVRRMVLGLPDLIRYSHIPLGAVYPNLEVLALRLPAQSASSLLANSELGTGGYYTPPALTLASWLPKQLKARRDTSVGLSSIQAVLATAVQSHLLSGLHKLRTLDLSACGPTCFSPSELSDLLQARMRSLDDAPETALQILMPTWAVSSPTTGSDFVRRWGQKVPEAERFCEALLRLTKGDCGAHVELLGSGLMIRRDSQLRNLCQLGTTLTQLYLLDSFTYRGTLSWGLLSGIKALKTLAVVPGSQESLTTLLQTLPRTPSLQSLMLSLQDQVMVGDIEMAVLARVPSLTSLEASRINVRFSIPGALKPLGNIKHLGADAIFIARRPLSDLFPGLEALSSGRCCRLEALRRPSVDTQGADAGGCYLTYTPSSGSLTASALMQAGPAGGAAVPAAGVGAGGAVAPAAGAVRPRGDWLNLGDICSCHHLKTLQLAGNSCGQVLEAWDGGLLQTDFLSHLRELHIWHVASYELLFKVAVELMPYLRQLGSAGLHHCGAPSGFRALGLSAAEPQSPLSIMGGMSCLKHLTIRAGDVRLVQQLSSCDLSRVQCIDVLEQPHLLPDDVSEIICKMREGCRRVSDDAVCSSSSNGQERSQGTPLKRINVRGCQNVHTWMGAQLQQLAALNIVHDRHEAEGGVLGAEAVCESHEFSNVMNGNVGDTLLNLGGPQKHCVKAAAVHVVVDSWSPAELLGPAAL
ncbi:hypothetical protein CEUSTIGMA_g7270.t1 [Chlamydomonas eustigma]|uniref:F-box domain-containing protein n=1 Tax=Chlamydomonas eustigma TaxID=1157962 RepID=A0A250XAP0_9CHLO|nr:hypothetical protein CEUSTIGMA_g7270.t1 [Chlamydomonas eustigma]|eukprot:GAX79830.1 hypothetical protein CEUSTIGMA_g7270.t1 [Chlamydomonas eustigma]